MCPSKPKFIRMVDDLCYLATKLTQSSEFSVDFQGITCLMQISARTEDFVFDTLKLREHIGGHLGELFEDPSKRKVMHGATKMYFGFKGILVFTCAIFLILCKLQG